MGGNQSTDTLFWTSGGVCPGSQKLLWIPHVLHHLCTMECSDSPLGATMVVEPFLVHVLTYVFTSVGGPKKYIMAFNPVIDSEYRTNLYLLNRACTLSIIYSRVWICEILFNH